MRGATIVLLTLSMHHAAQPAVLHWSSKLLHMSCDNHVVRADESSLPELKQRPPGSIDVLTATELRVTRTMGEGGSLALGICNGDVSVLASPEPNRLTVVVQLRRRLKGEETPVSYLQEFAVGQSSVDVEFKLPRSSQPDFEIYVPEHTSLELQMGNVRLKVRGLHSDININQGKGDATLYVSRGKGGFGHILIENAMGSFRDLRTPGKPKKESASHREIAGEGPYSAHIRMGMGTIELAPANEQNSH